MKMLTFLLLQEMKELVNIIALLNIKIILFLIIRKKMNFIIKYIKLVSRKKKKMMKYIAIYHLVMD